jgi:hypothetical protein
MLGINFKSPIRNCIYYMFVQYKPTVHYHYKTHMQLRLLPTDSTLWPTNFSHWSSLYSLTRLHRKQCFQQFLYCWVLIGCCGNVFTMLLPRSQNFKIHHNSDSLTHITMMNIFKFVKEKVKIMCWINYYAMKTYRDVMYRSTFSWPQH